MHTSKQRLRLKHRSKAFVLGSSRHLSHALATVFIPRAPMVLRASLCMVCCCSGRVPG